MRGLLTLLLLGFATPLAAQASLLTSHLRIHDPWVVADTDSQTYWLFSRNDPAVTGLCRPRPCALGKAARRFHPPRWDMGQRRCLGTRSASMEGALVSAGDVP